MEKRGHYYHYLSLVFQNKTTKIIKPQLSNWFLFHDLAHDFIIDNESYLFLNLKNEKLTEGSVWISKNETRVSNTKACNFSSFFLAKFDEDYEMPKIDFESLANEEIILPKEYDFSHLIPPVEVYKEIIDEYCARMDPIKFAPFQKQIMDLKNNTQTSAVLRIKNHLAYKLGNAIIENSKSIKGYIRLPYVLSYISDKHKLELEKYQKAIQENPNLALPALETYPDYQEALKYKEHLSYKLGVAFIKAYKDIYKGGLIKFIFVDIWKIRSEFREGKRR